MAKKHYMALDDLQTVWTNKLKPVVATKNELNNRTTLATKAEVEGIVNNYTPD